jgi:acetyl-CoA carboxylase alpha subunit
MKLERLLAQSARHQDVYWRKQAAAATKQLRAAVAAESRLALSRQERRVVTKQYATPFQRFVAEMMGSRAHGTSAELFVTASILRWQFMTKQQRTRFR